MDINYEYYKIFYYVGKYKNITKAAQALKNSQPNVTRVIKLLEIDLGCQLLIRGNKGIILTKEGEMLFERVSAAFLQIQAAEEELADNNNNAEGSIILGTTETALHLLLFDRLGEFRKSNPKVQFKIHNYNNRQAIKELKSGAVDFCVVTTLAEVTGGIKCEKLSEFEDVLICGKDYKQLSESDRSLEELIDYPWVTLAKDTITYDVTNDFFLRNGFILRPDIEVATADLMLPMISNNLGIGFVPEEIAAPEIQSGNVFKIELREKMDKRAVCVLYDSKKGKSKAENAFLQFLRDNRDI